MPQQQFHSQTICKQPAIPRYSLFIITSADSALLVCGLLSNSNNGKSKIIWAGALVTLSTSLLYTNDVDLNKQVAIAGALPFTLVSIIQAFFFC